MEVFGEGDGEGVELGLEVVVDLLVGGFGVVDCRGVAVVVEMARCY